MGCDNSKANFSKQKLRESQWRLFVVVVADISDQIDLLATTTTGVVLKMFLVR